MIYGYIRVSTEQQNTVNQKHEISTFAEKNELHIDKWVDETISSRKPLKERKLGSLIKKLKKGDILIASELSRLGRNLMEVMGILQKCLENECQVWTLKENYRLGADIQSKVLAFAFSLANEIERQLISDRTRESLKRVKAEGKHIGRPFGSTYRKLKRKHNKIKELLAKKVSKAEIARLLGCDWNTLNRYVKEQIVPVSGVMSNTVI
ncbi:MAG: master DNA invertase Mpi family serine-type recombinase [Alphaproteobacteria bacterium]|nr:master DNA invertase Mpi family serine-type recombinase [Alphaproteobacteria bacterium]